MKIHQQILAASFLALLVTPGDASARGFGGFRGGGGYSARGYGGALWSGDRFGGAGGYSGR
jgi:hypothetical protein